MDRITIETMELKNFKCHQKLSLVLKDQKLQILGAESSGKTSIQDAWCWLLYGKDSRGSTLSEVRPLGKNGRVREPWAGTQVTAVLRFSAPRPKVSAGEPDTITLSRSYFQNLEGKWVYWFQLNGRDCSKKDFDRAVKSLFDENLFWVLSFPRFFPENTSVRERTALLGSLLGDGGREETQYARLKEAAGDCTLGNFCLNLQKETLEEAKGDLPARISEMEGTLRQMGILDFGSMEVRRDCLMRRRQRLQKEGPSLALTALDQEISQLDQSLGQKTLADACAQRLLKLRKDQEQVLKERRLQRILQKEADKWLSQHLAVLEQAEKLFLRGGPRLDFSPKAGTPGCRIVYQGLPYDSLSRKEKRKVQLWILQFLSLLFEKRYPVFLDDWEGNSPMEAGTGQVIALCRDQREERPVVKLWQ